ncbi:branched-chain amino acid ABC transporter permease [Natronomonas salsuginis]|jgi:branched-chain amino acid transport system permease protein|uniref:Branched-chain amino acid ABC transporter permease n=1 Tax=Natronomonas salsuginis TaxID=2217661 RepID=A0A4U5J6Y3_9EURY|nr:branched-chain amino acid ABC transporter permease [Natronomonas salsuginis]TKR24384.1 branched-chain amino acid ABC transporter permease [Natronomonas salsuginis]
MLESALFASPGLLVEQTLNGLFFGFILFMIATGLTIIFGVLGILNLAHGEFYALGAFLVFSIAGFLVGVVGEPTGVTSGLIFAAVVILALLVSAAVLLPVSAIIETVLIRPIYDRKEVYQLLLTYALLLMLVDVMLFIWGGTPRRLEGVFGTVNQVPTTELVGFSYPSYNIFAILVGLGVFGFLIWFFERTKTGRIVRATAINREAATAMGVSPDRVFTLVFAMGGFFAGFAGAIHGAGPISAGVEMGTNPLVLSFVVIVVGGLGSIKGAFVAALLIGVASRWAILLYPPAELAAPFAIMVAVLLLRPEGLYGTWGEIE